MFNYENQIYKFLLFKKVNDVDIPEYILHCGLKYKSKGMWTQVTKVTRVFRDKFPKDAQYDTVISVIRQEYNLNPDASHCLVDMQNRIVEQIRQIIEKRLNKKIAIDDIRAFREKNMVLVKLHNITDKIDLLYNKLAFDDCTISDHQVNNNKSSYETIHSKFCKYT